ncbi:hypothetical protein [Cloacibacterium sp.]|uniref:hypothetical protein n=1 Tax=Cloacibacterium sp. TaxID=1913682 RepID=UPI0039E52D0A
MKFIFLSVVLLFSINFCFCQTKYDSIEFEHGNSIIIGSYVKIKLQPIKKNKKEKTRVTFESKDNFYTKKISKEKYQEICNSLSKIKYDTIVKTNCIDGSSTFIKTYKGNFKKVYYIDCISSKDQFDEKRKDFWYVTKLIVEIAGIRINNLTDYN